MWALRLNRKRPLKRRWGGRMATSIRWPADVLAGMKSLAGEHGRSLHKEVIQACKAWIAAERKARMSNGYEFSYAISKGEKTIEGSMKIEGANEQHARDAALDLLEQEFGDEEH